VPAPPSTAELVVAISSRALFDFEEENLVFETEDDRAYMQLQLARLEQPAKPGVAYRLVKKLLGFNADGVKRVDIVILSRNDPVSGLRVFRSVKGAELGIERGVFTRGRPPYKYLNPLRANLFLSANADDVRAALAADFPAALVYTQSALADSHPDEVSVSIATRDSKPFRRTKPITRRVHCHRVLSSRCSPPSIGCNRRKTPARCRCVFVPRS